MSTTQGTTASPASPSSTTETLADTLPRGLGRERELGRLEALHAEVQATGRGRVAWVTGPVGVGKAHLVEALRLRLEAAGVAVLAGRGRAGDRRSYQAVLDVLDGAVRALAPLALSHLVARALEVTAALQGLEHQGGAGDDRRTALFERVAELLGEVARRRRVALVFEDLDAADEGTRALVAHLAATRCAAPELSSSRGLHALLVATACGGAPGSDDGWLDGVCVEHVALAALDDAAVREILARPEVVAWFTRATGGRPEALAALLSGRAGAAPPLSRCSPEAAGLVALLALAGEPLPPDALARLGGLAALQHEAALAELLATRRVAQASGGALVLGRGVDPEAAAAELSPEARASLHRRLGSWFLGGGEAQLVAAAEHLLFGGAGELAVDTAVAAAARLESACSYERALSLHRRAWALTSRDAMRAAIEERLVELERLTGDYAGALADAERLRRRRPDDAAAWRRIAQLHALRDELVPARAALDRAGALSPGDAIERVRIAAASAELYFLAGDHAAARAACESGLAAGDGAAAAARPLPADGPRASRAGKALRIEILNTLGKVALAEGRYDEAEAHFAHNLDAARAAGLAWEETRALINQGITRLRLGDRAAAAHAYQDALKVAEASEDHRHRAFCLQNLGVLAHWRGDYATAIRYFQEAIAAFRRLGQRGRVAWLVLDLASLYLDIGALDRAVAMARLADSLGANRQGESPAAAVAINRALCAGRIALLRGDLFTARRQLAEARALAAQVDNHERHAEATLYLGRVELMLGDAAGALALCAAVGEAAPATRARALLLSGEAQAARREQAAARRALLGARDGFAQLGELDGQWRAELALARLAAAQDDQREAERRERAAAEIEARLRAMTPEELRPVRPASPAAAPSPAAPALSVAPPLGDAPHACYRRLVGSHPRLQRVIQLVEKIAPHDSLVLIRGESGTGKELVADAIHARSSRADRPLVKVNCGALVESLLLSELFGHERGAFTGAIKRKKGHFESADGGTIFLDEIGDISPRTQAALLRVLQERTFERVGSCVSVKVDVRILCATNRDLEAMVRAGQFREDLYYRLKGIQIDLPPLRERASDLPLLADHILARVADERGAGKRRFSPEALALLARHGWPGNVRELENVVRSASLFADGETIGASDLVAYGGVAPAPPRAAVPPPVVETAPAAAATTTTATATGAWERLGAEGIGLRELQQKIEIECITRALAEAGGNITRAAALLKMKRPRLSQLIKEYRIAL